MYRCIACLLFGVSSLFAQIHEIAHFSEIPSYVDQDTTVLFDIDDTLIAPSQMLGSDTWFEYRFKKYAEELDVSTALETTLAEWFAIRQLSKMQLVEPVIPQVIRSFQERQIVVMGLTAQGLALATRTVLQLKEHSVDLSLCSLFSKDCCYPVEGHTVLFRQGIVFASGRSKGKSFFQLCKQNNHLPKRIVAVDDKLSHLLSLEREAKERGVEFCGLRYGFSDTAKEAFNPLIADYQLEHSTLLNLLSDEEVRGCLQTLTL